MTTRLCSVVLVSQAVVLVFAAVGGRAVTAAAGEGSGATALLAGLALAVLAVVAAGAMRSRLGLWLGWLVQVGTFAYALIAPAMLLVGLLFTALWITAIVQGRRMDALTDAWNAGHPPPTGKEPG